MPSRNRIKQYIADSYYHLYNRGVEKRLIFLDDQDYGVFLSYLKTYLEPKDEIELQSILADPLSSSKEKDKALKLLKLNNFHDSIQLIAYILMPNHFHFFVKQTELNSIDRFMNSLCTRFTMYFNKKYKRVGGLFQSVYKGVLIQSEEQLMYLTRYIHRNIFGSKRKNEKNIRMLASYQHSSYPEYLGLRYTDWLHPEEVLRLFFDEKAYQAFVEDVDSEKSIKSLDRLTIDE